MFDPADKKNQYILDYFKDKTVLIVDPVKTLKTTIKKTFKDFGVNIQNIEIADNFAQATEVFDQIAPHYVITMSEIKSEQAIDKLLPSHLNLYPNRLDAGFILISEQNSMSAAVAVLEYEVDAFIVQPFTIDSIVSSIFEVVINKARPSDYVRAIEMSKEKIHLQQFDEAIELLDDSMKLDTKPGETFFYKGVISEVKDSNFEEAEENYVQGLELKPKDYKLMNNLWQIYYRQKQYKKAYEINHVLLENYPVNPKNLPDLIKLSIINNGHDDIIKLAEIFNEIPVKDPELQNYVSAGLAICGKHLVLKNDKKRGIECLKNAIKNSDKIEVLQTVCHSLYYAKEIKLMRQVIHDYTFSNPGKHEDKIKEIELQVAFDYGEYKESFKLANELLREGIKTVDIYYFIIESSIRLGRSENNIKELVEDARHAFPDEKVKFSNY